MHSAPLNQVEGKKFFVNCEVFNVSAKNFTEAVKYYDAKKNCVNDKIADNTSPVYKVQFSCVDDSIRNDKKSTFVDIWLYSYDGQGADFVERVNLTQLSDFSSFKQENALYEKRYNEVLEAESVKMTIEVLSDGKGSRAFRALNVKCWTYY